MAEAEKIQFKVETAGAREAAAEFERVAATLGKTSKEANDNAKKFGELKKSLEQARDASATLSAQTTKQGDVFAKLSQNASRGASVVNAFASALGSAVPGISEVGAAVGRTSGAMSAMTGILGGTAGLATGGILLAVGLFAKKLYDVAEETKNLAKATINYNTTLEKQLALIEAAEKASTRKQLMSMGLLSPQETQAEAQVRQQRQNQVRYELSQYPLRDEDPSNQNPLMRGPGGFRRVPVEDATKFERLTAEYYRLEKELNKLHADFQRLNEENKQFAAEDAANERDSWKTRGERQPTREGIMAYDRQVQALDQYTAGRQSRMDQIESYKKTLDDVRSLDAQNDTDALSRKKAAIEDERTARNESFNSTLKAARNTDRELAKLDNEAASRGDRLRQEGLEGVRMVGESGIQVFAALAKGEKVSAEMILAGIGDQLVAKGTLNLFEGIAREIASYGTDPSGAGLIGIGVAEIGAGIALGAASRGGQPTGGGGGGGGSPKYYVQDKDGFFKETAIEPTMRPSSSFGSTQVTNINMPTVVSPSAQDGQRIRKAENEARRQGV